MKVFLLAAIMAFGLLGANGAKWNLERMIVKAVGRKATTAFDDYGCNCIFRHNGSPVDAIDRCCAEHNCCLRRLESVGCRKKKVTYQIDYHWKHIKCSRQNYCLAGICECDKTLALCFSKNKNTYHRKYQYYEKKKCRGKSPKC